ncbi:MAG: heparinase II/III family protein, partial [Oscillospiraceae bacterium]|nr:heparinase II/III family protein [Oscillospiraceae bacterium]
DFESFYKLGITEDGVFDRELALQKNAEIVANGGEGYLVNKLYPNIATELGVDADKVSTWMVDDGFGWSDVDGTYGTNTLPKFCPAAHYAHLFWDSNGTDGSFFTRGIRALRDAYLYTSDAKYGRAGVILLDRVADVYPDFHLAKVSLNYPNSHGLGYNGKVVGQIWETNVLDVFNTAYDAFYPMTDDSQVIGYLSTKAEALGLENKKLNPDMIRENMEDGILRETFSAVKKGQTNGNFGMHQLNVTYAAVALDNQPETDEMFDWLGRYSIVKREPIIDPVYGGTWEGYYVSNSGGDILLKYVRDVDRDGFGNEVGLGYNALWLTNGITIAETINRYDPNTDLNLFENPKYVKMFSAFVRETLGDGYSIQIGDSGRCAGAGLSSYASEALRAYNATKKPVFAQIYNFYKGGELDDVYIDIFTDNDGLKGEIESVIETYGEYKLVSEFMTGFGLAVLRGGENIPSSSGNGNEQRYDTWMYSGITGGHGHYDSLALGIDAYGFNFMPDGGYPENTGYNPNRWQWANATISHNTVVVNNDSQSATSGSKPLHFDDSGRVKLIDVNSPGAYTATDIYRRTAVTIEASNEVAYTLDFFRVKGGDSHIYSFHTQSYMGYTTDDLNLVAQVDENGKFVGSYAGADVAYGEDPNTLLNSANYVTKYTRGYTWLDNVNRAVEPETGNFSVNFKQTDFNKQVEDSKGLNLKFTALNDWEPSSVGVMTGYAPRTSSNRNVPGLDYMLIQREGSDLDTLFTSLLQPYKGEAYIANASSVAVEVADGRQGKDDVVKAVKVDLTNGRVDY